MKRTSAIHGALLATASTMLFATPAQAQDQSDGETEAAVQIDDDSAAGPDDGTIVVTGSLIRNRDFDSPSPVVSLGQEQVANTAAVVVQDLFKGLTANAGSQQNNEQNALQGVSQFSLRGLGVGSTLTLINGRRAGLAPVSDETGQLFTDSNAFPVNAIERIEVLTDGASAT